MPASKRPVAGCSRSSTRRRSGRTSRCSRRIARASGPAQRSRSAAAGGEPIEATIAQLNVISGANQAVTARAVVDNAAGALPARHVRDGRGRGRGARRAARGEARSACSRSATSRSCTRKYGDDYEVRMLELGRQVGDWAEVLGGLGTGHALRHGKQLRAQSRRREIRRVARSLRRPPCSTTYSNVAITRRGLVLLFVLLLAALGAWNFTRLRSMRCRTSRTCRSSSTRRPPGYTPLEVEQRVSFPLENALAGMPRLEYTRSISRYGLSQITVVFRGRNGHLFRAPAGRRAHERREVGAAAGLEPVLGPIATGLGEIFMFTVDCGARRAQRRRHARSRRRTCAPCTTGSSGRSCCACRASSR